MSDTNSNDETSPDRAPPVVQAIHIDTNPQPAEPRGLAKTWVNDTPPRQPKGLAGWMLVPIFGLAFNVVSYVVTFAFKVIPGLTAPELAAAFDPSSTQYNLGKGILLSVEVCAISVLSLFCVFLFVTTFGRLYFVPRLYRMYYVFFSVFSIFEFLLTTRPETYGAETYLLAAFYAGGILRIAVPLAWIPYFILSKRVKNTFVRGRKERPAQTETPADAPVVEKPYDPENPYSYMSTGADAGTDKKTK